MEFHKNITKKFGPSPKLMRKAYITIVIPRFIYGCHLWGDKCQQEGTKKELKKLNRLACLLIANVAPSTPTKGLEVLYNIMPIEILVEKRASEIMARINNNLDSSWDGLGKNNKKGTILRWKTGKKEITNQITNSDRIPKKITQERKYKVHTPDDGRHKHKEVTGITSYTDGSVLNNRTGCGIHTRIGNRVIYNGHFYLGNETTVFQAEVNAIKKASEMLYNAGWENNVITIFSDSQSSLAALTKLTINSNIVDKCNMALNRLATKNEVHLRWIKAHVGIHGNEVADTLAKKGTTLGEGPSNEILPPYATQKKKINEYYRAKWNKEWELYQEARQTKIWFKNLNPKKSSQLLNMNRPNLSRMIQFITGHNKLKRHKNIQEGVEDPESCRLCLEDEESSFHVIAECPALLRARYEIFNKQILKSYPTWEVKQIEKFMKKTPLAEMLDNED